MANINRLHDTSKLSREFLCVNVPHMKKTSLNMILPSARTGFEINPHQNKKDVSHGR